MRFIRTQMHGHRQAGLTVIQFRALVFLNLHPDAMLSALAEQLGLSMPATSRLAEVLVRRRLIQRASGVGDRRRVSLSPTRRGRATFQAAQAAAQAALAERCTSLSKHEMVLVNHVMGILRRVFVAQTPRAQEGE